MKRNGDMTQSDYSQCNADMLARVKWLEITREWEKNCGITFLTDTIDCSTTTSIMIVFAGAPVRLPVEVTPVTNIMHNLNNRIQAALPIIWMEIEMGAGWLPWVRRYGVPDAQGNFPTDKYDINAETYGLIVSTLKKHSRTLTAPYKKKLLRTMLKQTPNVPKAQQSKVKCSYITQVYPDAASKHRNKKQVKKQQAPDSCSHCGKVQDKVEVVKMKRCSRCRSAYYCR